MTGPVESESDLLRVYLAEIGRHPLLTKDDEARLATAIQEGRDARSSLDRRGDRMGDEQRDALEAVVDEGERAFQQFVQANLRLVVSVARRYTGAGISLLDLVQEGNMGLMRAVERFDVRRGFRFSTYGTWWIRQAITRAIANTGRTIRLPVQAGSMVSRVRRAQSEFEAERGRTPTIPELADTLQITTAKVRDTLSLPLEAMSLAEHHGPEGDTELGDLLEDREATSPFDTVAAAMLPEQIRVLLQHLGERERRVVYLRYGLDRGRPRTLDEVGNLFSLSREQIRQIERRALFKLRERSDALGARDLLVG